MTALPLVLLKGLAAIGLASLPWSIKLDEESKG